jgi:hypothetical protein
MSNAVVVNILGILFLTGLLVWLAILAVLACTLFGAAIRAARAFAYYPKMEVVWRGHDGEGAVTKRLKVELWLLCFRTSAYGMNKMIANASRVKG